VLELSAYACHLLFDYGSFPLSHPNYIGMIDNIPEDGYDVVCCIGYRQNTRANAKDEKFTDAGTVIGIGHDPAMMGNTFALDHSVWGNVRHTLTALNAMWKPDHANLKQIQKRKQELAAQSKARKAKQQEQLGQLAKNNRPPTCRRHDGPHARPNTMVVSEISRRLPDAVRLRRRRGGCAHHGGSLGCGLAARSAPARRARPSPVPASATAGDVQLVGLLDHGALQPADPHGGLEQHTVPDGAHQRLLGRRMKRAAIEIPRRSEIDFVMLAKAQGIRACGSTAGRSKPR
jgi:hypothetical protein